MLQVRDEERGGNCNLDSGAAREGIRAVDLNAPGDLMCDPGLGANQIPVLFLTQEITRAFDSASPIPSRVLTHKPLIIVKELDVSSIQFFQAAVTNETLTSVSCTFYRTSFRSGAGGAAHGRGYFKITLTNAYIVDYKNSGDGIDGTASGDERERISLTYEKIDLIDLDNTTDASDFWSAGG